MKYKYISFFTLLCIFSSHNLQANDWNYKTKTPKSLETPIETIPSIVPNNPPLSSQNTPHKAVETPQTLAIPVFNHPLRVGDIVVADDITLQDMPIHKISTQHASDSLQVIGQQIRRPVQKFKPIPLDNLGKIITIKRNQEVQIIFQKGAMILTTVGRALEQGGQDDRIKVMNNESKKIVTGRINKEGNVDVSL